MLTCKFLKLTLWFPFLFFFFNFNCGKILNKIYHGICKCTQSSVASCTFNYTAVLPSPPSVTQLFIYKTNSVPTHSGFLHPSPLQPPYCMSLTTPGTSLKRNHTVFVYCLACCNKPNGLKLHPCGSMCQTVLPFLSFFFFIYGSILTHFCRRLGKYKVKYSLHYILQLFFK